MAFADGLPNWYTFTFDKEVSLSDILLDVEELLINMDGIMHILELAVDIQSGISRRRSSRRRHTASKFQQVNQSDVEGGLWISICIIRRI